MTNLKGVKMKISTALLTFSVVIAASASASANTIVGPLEYGTSNKSYATVTPGCALNPANRLPQLYVTVFANGRYLLNISINNVALTQLNGVTRKSTPVFLPAGQNVISAANGTLSTDYYVRDGGTGTCTLK